jgi:hypothetical protein
VEDGWPLRRAAERFQVSRRPPPGGRGGISRPVRPQGRPHRTCFQYTARDSEFLKYMENAYLATKVTFVTEFRRTCETLGADWPTVREGWLLGPRIEPAHTAALAHAPGFSGKCLPKDLHAIIHAATGAPGHGDAPRGRCRCAARRSRQARPMESSPSPAAGRRKRCSDVCHAGSLQDEYAHGRRLGLITDTLHSRVDQARQQVIALIEARQGPFTGDWAIHQPAPGWPALALPRDTLTAPSPL